MSIRREEIYKREQELERQRKQFKKEERWYWLYFFIGVLVLCFVAWLLVP